MNRIVLNETSCYGADCRNGIAEAQYIAGMGFSNAIAF